VVWAFSFFVKLDLRIRSGNIWAISFCKFRSENSVGNFGHFVFVKLDLSIRSGNSGMGIFVFVKLDLRIRSGNSCMGNFVL
jgi:hypothetical protein